jgi:hypothetical protein
MSKAKVLEFPVQEKQEIPRASKSRYQNLEKHVKRVQGKNRVFEKSEIHALKIESLDIEVTVADQIESVLHNFLTDLGYSTDRIDPLECRSRDGFSPFSHNKGGLEAIAFKDQYYCQIEGTGFENADNTLNKYYDFDLENFERDTDLDLPSNRDDWTEDHWTAFDEYRQEDYQATVLFGCDLMLTGESELNIRLTICVKDAPYHRQYDDLIEVDLEFTSVKDLESQLESLIKRTDVTRFSHCLNETY